MPEYFLRNPQVVIDGSKDSKPLRRFWEATGYANADFTYTKAFRRMYDYLDSYHNHLYYMRLHNILTLHGDGDQYFMELHVDYGNQHFKTARGHNGHSGNDKVVTMNPDGTLAYNWDLVDQVYDVIVEHGMAPIVEMCFIPAAIQKNEDDYILPKDFHLYSQVVTDFTSHCLERYGREELLKWYFEIWNEPCNHKEWCENPESFFAMYDYFVQAVHAVDPQFKTGGPATKQFDNAYQLFEAFLEHCAHGVNYATGGFGSPLDFISVHCKGGWPEGCSPSSDVMFDAIHRYLDIIEKYPEYKDTEFFNDESDIVWDGNKGIWEKNWLNFRNTHYAPGFVCKMVSRYCTDIEDGRGVNLAVVDSDNAHLQWERYLFSGNRSQFTPLISYPTEDLIKKPFFNAYVLLSRLGNVRLRAESEDAGFGYKYGVIPTLEGDSVSIMIWNFEDGLCDTINQREISLKLKGLGLTGEYRIAEFRIDKDHSNSNTAWHAMGAPAQPTQEQIKKLRQSENLELTDEVGGVWLDGDVELSVTLPMHAVSLLLITPKTTQEPEPVTGLTAVPEQGFNGNRQIFLKWEPSTEPDFLYYKVVRRNGEGDDCIISDRKNLNTATFVDMDVEMGKVYTYRIVPVNTSFAENRCSEELTVIA